MSNILNHNRNIFDFKLIKNDYWDFHLSLDNKDSIINYEECLAVDIDTDNNDCIWFDKLTTKDNVTWKEAVNDGLKLKNIGYTGMDNGFISYEKDKITNKEFLHLFLHSEYTNTDKKFTLYKINGNNQIYDYSNDMVYEDDVQVMKLNGGFYQGFFKSDNYQVLPDTIDSGMCFSFDLKKEDFINEKPTLNSVHPNNKGLFFYIGTRAENKWWEKYTTAYEYKEYIQKYVTEYCSEYIENDEKNINTYLKSDNEPFDDGYFAEGYVINDDEIVESSYVDENYFEKDINLKDVVLKTEEGYDLYQPNIFEIKTDNKFITYNRTKEGLTTITDKGDTEIILYDIKTPSLKNYFLLFNRTCNGYTTENIQYLIDEESKKYDVLADIYDNALGFRINDKGQIGYRYLVKNCDTGSYKILEEYSFENIIKEKEWTNVKLRIIPYNKGMQISIYVNGKIVLVSKELPKLNLRYLDDLHSKQEGVPFNISLGGGTQGLCDRVDINYMTPPSKVLPIEENFAGSFIGYLKSFKCYCCPLDFNILSKTWL